MGCTIIDKDKYYRKGVFRHFSEDCKCSVSMTAKIDVTELAEYSAQTGTKFYINFLYVLSKVLNSRDDYRMGYLWQTNELVCYDQINPLQYVFHEDTETCTPVYTKYYEDYSKFYENARQDIECAKQTREYSLEAENHPNWFDASYIPWVSYDALNIELPDGYLYFAPIINWGKYREENGRLLMPVTVRMNHAIADGYLIANVFRLLDKEITSFILYQTPIIETGGRFMLLPEPINQEEIDQIKEKYRLKIKQNPDLETVYRVQEESAIADAIGRQRQEAIAAGGELGARIQAENEAMMREADALRAQISDADIATAQESVRKMESLKTENSPTAANKIKWVCKCGSINSTSFCPECGQPKSSDRWICSCGNENIGKFCTECGAKKD